MKVIDKRDYAAAVQAEVVRFLSYNATDLSGIQAVVGYEIGATDEQVKYAVRVLRTQGRITYDKANGWYYAQDKPAGWYYLVTKPTRKAE